MNMRHSWYVDTLVIKIRASKMCSGLAGAGPLQPGAGGKNINMPTFAAAPICLNFQLELMVMLPTESHHASF